MVTMARAAILDQEHARVGRWMHQEGSGHWSDGATCIGLERDGALVAGVMFDFYNGSMIVANIVIRGPVTREWLWFICHYPFVQLHCQVVIGLVAEENIASHRFVQKFGFRHGLTIHDADPSGSLTLYTLRKEDCRFLRRSYYGQARSSACA